MKLQHLTIIFAIIFLPIILITSYYIQKQVDTINLQLSYDAKLLNAARDALTAFEINTADEDLSTVPDSLRSIIDASNNIFLNVLATNMGASNASKSYVQPYIPAIVYTLYDGYYIYSPARVPIVCKDSKGQTITTDCDGVTFSSTITVNGQTIGIYSYDGTEQNINENDTSKYNQLVNHGISTEYSGQLYKNKDGSYSTILHSTGATTDTEYKQSYILKSYIPYSANYDGTSNGKAFNVNINYTLDNYISINGMIGEVYYTKCGYLIDDSLVQSVTVNGTGIDWYTYSESDMNNRIQDPANFEVVVTLKNKSTVTGDENTVTISNKDHSKKVTYLDTTEETIYWDDAKNAVEYYTQAWMFSKWVYSNLSELKESDINSSYDILLGEHLPTINQTLNNDNTTAHSDSLVFKFEGRNNVIFNNSVNPEGESVFIDHKHNVMRNSINYNLALAVVSYSEMSSTKEFELPILKESEWDKLLSNVSILVFMQGLNCGLKYYSNYAVVTSTNNEITVTPSEILYVPYKIYGKYKDYYERIGGEVTDTDANLTWETNLEDDLYTEEETAHRIDCSDLEENYIKLDGTEVNIDYYVSFKAKDIKYDKIYNKLLERYSYDHKALQDYKCIIDGNYNTDINYTDSHGRPQILRGNTNLVSAIINKTNKLKAYRIAVGKERESLFKSIKYDVNGGYQIFDFSSSPSASSSISQNLSIDRPANEIYKIQIILQGIAHSNRNIATDTMNVTIGGITLEPLVVSTRGGAENIVTYEFNVDSPPSPTLTINFARGSTATLKAVKVYYK